MIITSQAQFERWLDSSFWLEDFIIHALEPLPKPVTPAADQEVASQVRLAGTLQVKGGYSAGDRRWMRDIELLADQVMEYSLSGPDEFVPNNCCQRLELMVVEQGVGFTLDVPGELRIVCARLHVTQHPDREELVEPWLSAREFSATVVSHPLPTPGEWVQWFQAKGLDVVLRYIYGEAREPNQVPATDYTGWFLQLRSRLDQHPEGLFFAHCTAQPNGFSVHLVNYDEAVPELLVVAGRYMASFPDVTVSCGNTTLSREEWLAYLEQL